MCAAVFLQEFWLRVKGGSMSAQLPLEQGSALDEGAFFHTILILDEGIATRLPKAPCRNEIQSIQS